MVDQVLVNWEALQAFTKAIFARAGLPEKDAATEAEVLVWANLRGVDSHGVQRIPLYINSIEAGYYNARPNIEVIKETPATLFIEADHAMGPVVTVFAMERVIAKAREVGVGWGLIRNTTHQGAMAYYALMAARQGMAGLALVCNPPNTAPTGARAAGIHNSPIAIAVPGNQHNPIVLDMATSVVAQGKMQVYIDKGLPIPEGWALDKDGNPTTDPSKAALMLPAGGYKGYGLALLFECLSSIMAGNPLLSPTLLDLENKPPRGTQNSVVVAVNIGLFTDVEGYKDNIDDLAKGIKGLPKQPGVDEILIPGEPEDRVHAQRKAEGIPLPAGTFARLQEVAVKFGVEMPPTL